MSLIRRHVNRKWQTPVVATRKYEQRKRAESAAETRRRILDALTEQLREAPTAPLSLDHVARAAGVARSTLYVIFGSRQGLLEAVAADLADRTGLKELAEAVAHPDAREHLRQGMRAGFAMFEADRTVWRALRAMAELDPKSLGASVAVIEQNRAGGMAHLANRLAAQGELRPDVSVDEAADLLWVMTSFDSYELLRSGRGLDFDETVERLVAAAERSVCT
jgi:AcrR family transcriptional regulator